MESEGFRSVGRKGKVMSFEPMTGYFDLIARLGYRRAARITPALAESGEYGEMDLGPIWSGFPPALIPFQTMGSGFPGEGVWKHWFVPRRSTFVRVYREDGDVANEIARTEAQLVAAATVAAIEDSNMSDDPDDFLRVFTARLEVPASDLRRYLDLAYTVGTYDDALAELAEFRDQVPLEAVQARRREGERVVYDGDMPVGTLRDSTCYFDYPEGALEGVENLPPWLEESADKQALFDTALVEGDHAKAWLTLNGTGWRPSQTSAALAELIRQAPDDAEFAAVAQMWIDQARDQDEEWGYCSATGPRSWWAWWRGRLGAASRARATRARRRAPRVRPAASRRA